MCFEMSPQIGFLNGCIVTVVEICLTFSTVHFQMSPQIAFLNRCIFALVAFIQLFSNVSSNCLPQKRNSRICCIPNTTMTTCGFSNVSSYCLPQKRNSRIGYICLISPHYVISNVSSNLLSERMQSHSGCISLIFSTVHFQMSPQIAFLNGCIAALVAFI